MAFAERGLVSRTNSTVGVYKKGEGEYSHSPLLALVKRLMARRAALQRYTQHSSRANDKEDLKQEGGGNVAFLWGLRKIIFLWAVLLVSAAEYDRPLKADLPFLNCVCVEENTKELNYLFFRSVVLDIFQRRHSFARPILGPIQTFSHVSQTGANSCR